MSQSGDCCAKIFLAVEVKEFFMFRMFRQLISVLGRISLSTHLHCISVLGAAVLLCVSFFVEPSERQFVADDAESLRAQIIIEYSSVLGSLSGLDGLENKVVAEIVDAIPTDIEEEADVSDDDTDTKDRDALNEILAREDFVFPDEDYAVDISRVYSPEAVDALERLVQSEAATEDYDGRVLVADVVLNRVDTGIWGDDILSVIESPGQFIPVANGAYKNAEVDHLTKDAVLSALSGDDDSKGAIYFQKSEATSWGDKEFLFRHGSHSFYK